LRLDVPAALVLADWLDERGDPRAGDVRELAEARCVVPRYRPSIPTDTAGMACGAWWVAIRTQAGVNLRAYPDSPQGDQLCDVLGQNDWDCDLDNPDAPTDDQVRLAFDTCRLVVIGALLGHYLPELRLCRGCGCTVDDEEATEKYRQPPFSWDEETGYCLACWLRRG
jgi:hypothetical protein